MNWLRFTCVLACFTSATCSITGQIVHPQASMPTFEVASIRPWKPLPAPPPGETVIRKIEKVSPVGVVPSLSPRVHFIGQMELLLESAYGLPVSSEARIVGAPDWVRSESDRYELSGKIDDVQFAALQKLPSPEQQKVIALMEQSVLKDRLALRVHFEAKVMPVYSLSLGRGGPKLEPSHNETSRLSVTSSAGQHTLVATAVSMDELVASPFLRQSGRPTVNATGLKGRYDFTLQWSADDVALSADGSASTATLKTALEQQLGLRLSAARAPVEVVVIDHIERPSEN